MSILAKAPTARTYGSGNKAKIIQLKRNTDGTFTALDTADVFGEIAPGAWHDILSLIESPIERQEDGSHRILMKGVEDDLNRKKFALLVAPFSATSNVARPELNLEDGTNLVSSGSNQEDTSRPYFQIAKVEMNPTTGKKSYFYAVGQFSRATKRPNKFNTLNEKDFTFFTVNANGYASSNPTGDTDFTGAVAPTLSGGLAHGTYVDQP